MLYILTSNRVLHTLDAGFNVFNAKSCKRMKTQGNCQKIQQQNVFFIALECWSKIRFHKKHQNTSVSQFFFNLKNMFFCQYKHVFSGNRTQQQYQSFSVWALCIAQIGVWDSGTGFIAQEYFVVLLVVRFVEWSVVVKLLGKVPICHIC